jgi:hypothetical protein
MKKLKRLLLNMILMSLCMGLSIEGDGGAPAEGGAPAGGDPAPVPAEGAAPIDPAAEALAAAETARLETERVAALTPEAKAAEEAAAAEKDGDKGKTGAPEEYAEFTLKEGQTLDQAALDYALPIFKELGLTQEQAQKLVNIQAEGMAKATEAFTNDKAARLDAIKNDKEYGGDKFVASSEAVGRALNTLLSADEQADLKAYTERFGPNPTLFRLMYRVATKALSEDTRFEQGGQNGVAAVNFYPNSKMKQ